MTLLIIGLLLFLGVHAFTSLRQQRAEVIGRFGEGGFKGAYTAVAIVGLLLVIYGFGVYRGTTWIEIWSPPVWTRHLALLINLPIFILLAASNRKGWIQAKTKHPMLLAVKLWATAHLLANGDLGSMLMFGGFLAWAVLARISIKRRPEEAGRASSLAATPFGRRDVTAIVVGLALYVAFALWLHPLLIGVPVLPGR
jgi:uncharacterized membrane protein